MDSLNNQLKRIATGISGENSPTSSTTDSQADTGRDCPICDGMGFVTRDVPVDHPDFGKAFPCVCKQEDLLARHSARLYRLSNLEALADKTFETFIVDLPSLTEEQLSSLRAGCDLAWRYAQAPQGWLLLQGSYGSGKTHLGAAIANFRLAAGQSVLFLTTPDLLDHLRSTYGPSSEIDYDSMFDQVRTVPLLVLDDLGAESATPWAQEKLYQLVNHRYVHRLCTVFTTNSELDQLDPRIRSRLVDQNLTRSIALNLPDFRRRDASGNQNPLFNIELYHMMVFETFDTRQRDDIQERERRNLLDAYRITLEYAENPEGWLLLLGEHGCGKTHLAAAVANYRHRQYNQKVAMVAMPDLLDYLRAAFNPSASVPLDQRFHEIRTVPLLVIDQLDTSSGTSWALEKLRQIANHRYLANLPTIFTSAQPFEQIDPVLRSRLSDSRRCYIFAIVAPDYRGGSSPRARHSSR